MLAQLPEMEETITRLVVELLLLERERSKRYRGLLLDDPENGRAVRVTMHYVMALLAYGFLPDSPQLQNTVEWFDQPFPKRDNDHIDPAEMNRLHVLLHLKPDNPNVQTRLEQLVAQKVKDEFDVQPSWSAFDTLWALKIFKLAHEKGVLPPEIATREDMRRSLDHLLENGELRRDKDIALALRLQQELFGGLEDMHHRYLDRLIRAAHDNQGVWGLEELGWRLNDMEWLKKLVRGNKLTPEEVRPFQEQFRRVILSTCMVIESLAPLVCQYSGLKEPVEKAIKLWWEQFYGEHAIETLRQLFPHPHEYDYILVLTRTLRALRRYLDAPLSTLDTVQVHILTELVEVRKDLSDPPDVAKIKEALRRWIRIDLNGEIEPLKLGLSEANVVRVQPHIWSPMDGNPDAAHSLINQSLIIKYGPEEIIKTERANYEKIPAATRDCFVRIPEESYIDTDGRAFVVMQDLRDYKTLYESREIVTRHVGPVGDHLSSFLRRMHTGGSEQWENASASLLREIYLRKMLEHVDRIFDYIWWRNLPDQVRATEVQNGLFAVIGDLIRRQGEMEPIPAAYMHGDLHMRNIMIAGLHGTDGTNNTNDLMFKLIDLEYLRPDGDAAFDAGQLLVDIDMVAQDEMRYETRDQLLRLKTSLKQTYEGLAENRNDHTFLLRVELAKARMLLRVAKGKTKRGNRHFIARQVTQAQKIAEEVLKHAEQALQHIEIVVKALG